MSLCHCAARQIKNPKANTARYTKAIILSFPIELKFNYGNALVHVGLVF